MSSDSIDDSNSDESNRTVVVHNLPNDYDESSVRTLFANVGTVLNCSLNFDSNKMHLISTVEFSSKDEAEAAIILTGVSVRYNFLKIEKYKKLIVEEKEKEVKQEILNVKGKDSKEKEVVEQVNLIDVQDKLAKVLEARDKILDKIKYKEQDYSNKQNKTTKKRISRWDINKPIVKK